MRERVNSPSPRKSDALTEAPHARNAGTSPAGIWPIDAMLDEIDDVSEANAEQFVRAFAQKGGQ